MFRTRISRTVAAVALSAAASGAVLAATASPALAYNFPFPDCGRSNYYDLTGYVEARYDHRDGNRLWYKIYFGPTQPVPSDPYNSANWAHCDL